MSETVTRRGTFRRFVLSGTRLAGLGALMAGGLLFYVAFGRPASVAQVEPEPAAQTPRVRYTAQPVEPVIEARVEPLSTTLPDRAWTFTPEEPAVQTAAPDVKHATGPMFARHGSAQRAPAAEAPPASVPAAARGGVTYKPAQIEGHEATVVRDLESTIRPGTVATCTLRTAIDGNRGGYLRCGLNRPVMSWGGHTALLQAGDEVIGTYQSLSVGDKRMMAMAATVTTRVGNGALMVQLGGSPVTDALGRSGMPGYVEERSFFEKLGNALLLDGTSSAIALPQAALRGQGGSVRFDTGDTEQAVTRSVQAAVNQAPAFRKNQGEEVAILITAPIHFGALRHEVIR